jgi:hypothetical protein
LILQLQPKKKNESVLSRQWHDLSIPAAPNPQRLGVLGRVFAKPNLSKGKFQIFFGSLFHDFPQKPRDSVAAASWLQYPPVCGHGDFPVSSNLRYRDHLA